MRACLNAVAEDETVSQKDVKQKACEILKTQVHSSPSFSSESNDYAQTMHCHYRMRSPPCRESLAYMQLLNLQYACVYRTPVEIMNVFHTLLGMEVQVKNFVYHELMR